MGFISVDVIHNNALILAVGTTYILKMSGIIMLCLWSLFAYNVVTRLQVGVQLVVEILLQPRSTSACLRSSGTFSNVNCVKKKTVSVGPETSLGVLCLQTRL